MTQAVNTCKFCGQDKKYCVGPRSCWLSREPGNQIDELEEANRKPLPPPEKIEPEYGPHEIPTKDAAGRPLDPISGKLLEQPARDKKQIKNPLGDQYKEKQ